MLTSRSASKPSRIQPGDEYASFGGPIGVNSNSNKSKSPKKSRKNKNQNTPLNDGFGSYGFHAGSGLSSTGELTNPFGEIVSDYDIEVSYAALSALSDDKRVTMTQFTQWMNQYLQLNWNEQRIKRAWAVLDQEKAKYITFKEFRSGLKSTNSDVILFYSNLMQRTDVHPMKGDKSDWETVKGPYRIKRMREFTPRYLRQFSRKKNKKLSDFQTFLLKWRKFSIDFLHSEYWKPVQESNKNYGAIVGNLWQKICNMTGMLTAEYASNNDTKYDIITYELFVIIERVCKHQQFIAYLGYKHMCTTFIMNFNMYDVNDSNVQGKIAWCEGAMVGMIKYANRPTMSLNILNHICDLLVSKLGAQTESVAEEKEKSKDKDLASIKIPKVWNVCCKRAFLRVLCIAIDCTESAKAIKDVKGKEGGVVLIKKLSELCLRIFTRTENSAFDDVIIEGYKLLSRIDIMNSQLHDKVLKQMQSHQIKKYNRNFGKARIVRFGGGGAAVGSPKYGSVQTSKIKPGYGAESPTQSKGYTQKYRIGQLGASVAMNKMKSISTKSRIIDVNVFNKLQSPFEFKLQKEDVISAFRYADVNQDNAISFTDFTQSLGKVGVVKDDDDAREMWLILNPSNSSKGVNLDKFERKLRQYPTELHNWLCRIISCNHLARQPFKTDPDGKRIKKILKDQRKLTWKERIDALHSVARLFARTNDSKKEFQNKFKSFLPRLLDHLRDPHSLVVRAAAVSLTKIMIYKNGSMTKYTVKIMEALTLNFKKSDRMVTESSFGCFANLVRHVPDNKKFATLQHILKLVQFKNVSVRCFGWRIAAITFERILGLKKARPSSWWQIAENILKTGKKEKSNTVQREAIRLLFIFQNSSKHYHYIEQYIRFFPVPDNMESLKSTVVSDIQARMDEYANEAAAQADAMDVYSLISTEQDPQEEAVGADDKKDDVDSVGGGGRFDFVDDIMDGKEAKANGTFDPLANRGLGKRLVLHAINRDTVARVYELYDIGHSVENTRTLLASLKYLGINIGRGELTLLLSEIKNIMGSGGGGGNNEYNEFTPDKYAFFVKHCFATLDVAWKTYLSSSDMDAEIAEFANISNVKKEFDSKMVLFEALSANSDANGAGSDVLKKCVLLADIYNLFVMPEVENDEILFEEMMERLNPVLLHELAGNMHSSILIQEICIIICRITQYHINRVAEFGRAYYDLFFQIIGYGSSIVAHCCSKTCLVIASMVQFLNVPTANDMTRSLLKCMDLYPQNEEFQLKIYKCLLAEILVNVPLIRDQQIKSEVIEVIWSIMKEKIYAQIANEASTEKNKLHRVVCLNILAYMHSASYLNLYDDEKEKEALKLNEAQWNEVEAVKESKNWHDILRQDIDANETAPFNNLALEHGWDNLKYYSKDFADRNLLLEQWYELEEKTNNPIGMAAVTQLIKALNYTQYKAKKTQTPQTSQTQTQTQTQPITIQKEPETEIIPIHNATDGGNDLNSLRAKYLEMQRKQNQQKN